MKIKKSFIFTILITALLLAIYYIFANQLIKAFYNSPALALLEETIEKYTPLQLPSYPRLIFFFTLNICALIFSIIASISYPDFFRKAKDKIVLFTILPAILYQFLFNNAICNKYVFFLIIALTAIIWLLDFPHWLWLLILASVSSAIFFYKFPISEFNNLIFQDDYPKYFYFAKHQLNIFTHWSLFGWNDSFSGGYPTFMESRLLGVLFIPFAIFGDNTGFHLILYFFYISLPLAIYWLSHTLTQDKKTAIITSALCGFSMLAYFTDMLDWGLIPGFISLTLFVLSQCLLENVIKKKNFGLLVFVLILALILYLHIFTFIFTFIFSCLRIATEWRTIKKGFPAKKTASYLLLLIIISLPLIYPLIKYGNYITTYYYSTQTFKESLMPNFLNIIKYFPILPIWLLNSEYFRCLWMILPILIFNLSPYEKSSIKKCAAFSILFFFIMLISPALHHLFALEIKYLTPIFISLAGGIWAMNKNGKVSALRFAIILLICSFMIKIYPPKTAITHIKNIYAFKPTLIDKISRLDGNMVLLENFAHLNPYDTFKTDYLEAPYPHLEGIMALSTNKSFLSHYGDDPYPYYKFREGIIVNGVFEGKDIENADIEKITAILQKWGIKYIVLWSAEAKKYFQKFSYFEEIFNDNYFSIFIFKGSDGKELFMNKGQGKIIPLNYFHKRIILSNVIANETITIRKTYFPAWRAKYNDKRINLFENNGQLAFLCPDNGDIEINLYFPRYTALLISGLLSIIFFIYLELREINRRHNQTKME